MTCSLCGLELLADVHYGWSADLDCYVRCDGTTQIEMR